MDNYKKRLHFNEWISVQIVKRPRTMILLGIILGNLFFMFLSALILAVISPAEVEPHGFWQALFYTITMILDAGCINYIVDTISHAGPTASFFSLCVVLIGMISFTGCVIGYITNAISGFIDNANSGDSRLNISNHTVILNWNSRASEIINDLLYSEYKERIVVLVENGKEEIEDEIRNRLADTINQENKKIKKECENLSFISRRFYFKQHQFKNDLTVIVREGDTFSENQLMDISLDKAKAVIILNRDQTNTESKYTNKDKIVNINRGNSITIKTLVLVAEITSNEGSADDQKIIVEVDDEWTLDLVQKIIQQKEKIEKCNIIPVSANRVLGQLLSQFSIMPNLNKVYSTLFSNEGAEFYSENVSYIGKNMDVIDFLEDHTSAVPLTTMNTKVGLQYFYMANVKEDVYRRYPHLVHSDLDIEINRNYWLPRRNVLILGHNSKITSIMDGFMAFRSEWNEGNPYGKDILNLGIVDDKEQLELNNNFKDYSYVNQKYVVAADLYDQLTIYETVNSFIDDEEGDTCIMILSDDLASQEDLDASALTYLIYVQDILSKRRKLNGGKDSEKIDVVIEILNPKNYDVIRSYSVDNIVISNRYISKMITQIGEKECLFEFYRDILTYDLDGIDTYESKELYIKRCGDYLTKIPGTCNAHDLIRGIYKAAKCLDNTNECVLLGYIDEKGKMFIFSGNQYHIEITLNEDCYLILFANH